MKKHNEIWRSLSQGILTRPIVVLAIYFSTILIFGYMYWYFNIPFKQGKEIISLCFLDSMYFSVVTITTLGYGDISPTNEWGKLLTSMEAVSGILILGLFLSAYAHKLAIRYQKALTDKESEIAIKLLYIHNWYEINEYYWHLCDAKKALAKIKMLSQSAIDSSESELEDFTESVRQFDNNINAYNFQHLDKDKTKAIKHLDRLFGVIDPVRYKQLLHHISDMKSRKPHEGTKRFMEDLKSNLSNFDKSDAKLSSTSAKLQGIEEWVDPELISMKTVIDHLDNICDVKNKREL